MILVTPMSEGIAGLTKVTYPKANDWEVYADGCLDILFVTETTEKFLWWTIATTKARVLATWNDKTWFNVEQSDADA